MAKNTSKRTTKKDLEEKIIELEQKLSQLSEQLLSEAKPESEKNITEQKTDEKSQVKSEPEPKSETAPEKSQSASKQEEKPKPTQTVKTSSKNSEALETIYQNSEMSNPFDYKTKTPGYSPSPNRYYERLHAKGGVASTSDWNLQKSKVTGYTAPSNQYFATRQRLAYHPPEKRFDGFDFTLDGKTSANVQSPPPEETKPKTQELEQPEKKQIAQTSGKEMTREIAESLIDQKLDVLLYGDHQIGTVAAVNFIDDRVFLRLNLQKGSLGMPLDDIKEWSIMQDN